MNKFELKDGWKYEDNLKAGECVAIYETPGAEVMPVVEDKEGDIDPDKAPFTVVMGDWGDGAFVELSLGYPGSTDVEGWNVAETDFDSLLEQLPKFGNYSEALQYLEKKFGKSRYSA